MISYLKDINIFKIMIKSEKVLAGICLFFKC